MTEPATIAEEAELWIDRGTRRFAPGERLTGGYRLAGWREAGVRAVELSVLWYTSGQGEEDFFVTHFERRKAAQLPPVASDTRFEFETVLPDSPHSYQGQIVRVGWAVRLRGHFGGGRQRLVETLFSMTPDAARGWGGET